MYSAIMGCNVEGEEEVPHKNLQDGLLTYTYFGTVSTFVHREQVMSHKGPHLRIPNG